MYADDIDFASELAERERVWAAAQRRPSIVRTGKCKACGAVLANPQAFVCDEACRQDFERQEKADVIAGRRR